MKGQYLAVESLLGFGLGLTLAVGLIGSFEIYSSEIDAVAKDVQIRSIQNEVLSSINTLQSVNGDARKRLDLSDSVGGQDYNIEVGEDLILETGNREYRKPISIDGDISGQGSGELLLTKNDGNYRLRDN